MRVSYRARGRLLLCPRRLARRTRRRGPARGRSGQARRELGQSVRERLRDKVEANAEKVWAAHDGALEAVGPDRLPDHRARYHPATALLAEAYGKPILPAEEKGRSLVIVRPPRADDHSGDLPANVHPLPAREK